MDGIVQNELFIGTELGIVSGFELSVLHMVIFHAHESSIIVRFHLLVSIHSIQGIIYLPECLFHFLRGDILIGNRSGITQFLLGEGLGVLPYLLKLFRDSGYAGMYRFAPQTNV